MSNVETILWLIPALPLLAAVVTAVFGPCCLRKHSHWPCLLAIGGSCLLALWVWLAVLSQEGPGVRHYYTWFAAGDFHIGFALRADGLTAILLLTVTFIGLLIAIFAIGYMSHEREHEAGYARFFAEIALFIFAMTGLVLADNYLLLYAFWEGVGLCSYLLIGFWFEKPSAAAAARKAFLVTRLGDVGLILGILLLWAGRVYADPASAAHALDYGTVFPWASGIQADDTDSQLFFGAVALLLFCGAVGKSAQFPLHVWLPDAMEGPTPVSALIHAATMVTAGVYLVARSMPIFHAAPPGVLVGVACTGAFTALLAALIALTQNDLKRVLAYSTISQLGYMFLALGCAIAPQLVPLAVTAAIFHLFTHAFFKALLFLAAGSVMHAMGNVIDMRRFSGLRQVLPQTHGTFLCGALALAGVVPLSGFWSKDEILAAVLGAGEHAYGQLYGLLFVVGLVTAGLTAFYTFRAYFLTFWGEVRVPPEAGDHAHESPPVMTVPLIILAVFAAGIGMVVQPFTHGISHLLEFHWLRAAFAGRLPESATHGPNLALIVGSTAFAVAGVGLAWWMYTQRVGIADQLAKAIQGLYQLSLNKFHLDEIYQALIVRPALALASLCRIFDQYVVDSLVDLCGQLPSLVGKLLRPIQNGLVQFYALAMILGLTVFLSALVLRLAQ